jgi:hypothetical protein
MKRSVGAACAVSILFSLCFVFAFAQNAGAEVTVKPWAQIFSHYQYNMSGYEDYDSRFDTNDHNNFDVSQARLWMDATFNDQWSGRLVLYTAHGSKMSYETATITITEDDPATEEDETETVDAVTSINQSNTGPYEARLFYAYATYQPFQWLGLDFGLVQSAYLPIVYKFWKYRYIMKPYLFEYRLSRAAGGDTGVAIHGNIPGGYGGYRVRVANGEGCNSVEVNAGKAIEGSVFLFPFQSVDVLKGLALYGMYRYEKNGPDDRKETLAVMDALLSYRLDINENMGFSLNAEYGQRSVDTDDKDLDPNPVISSGYSAWADIWFAKKYGLLFRYDYLDPNTENDEDMEENGGYRDEEEIVLAGLWYHPIKQVRICPNYRFHGYWAKIPDDNDKTVSKQPDQFVFINTEIKFK